MSKITSSSVSSAIVPSIVSTIISAVDASTIAAMVSTTVVISTVVVYTQVIVRAVIDLNSSLFLKSWSNQSSSWRQVMKRLIKNRWPNRVRSQSKPSKANWTIRLNKVVIQIRGFHHFGLHFSYFSLLLFWGNQTLPGQDKMRLFSTDRTTTILNVIENKCD